RAHREAVGGVPDERTAQLIDEALAFPSIPRCWATPDLETPLSPVIPMSFEKENKRFDFFSLVTSLGTPQDVTLQELRIECFFPLDDQTARNARALAVTA